jgi:hypothetical protein
MILKTISGRLVTSKLKFQVIAIFFQMDILEKCGMLFLADFFFTATNDNKKSYNINKILTDIECFFIDNGTNYLR